ncbi:MAG: 3-hydroxyacyl-CoA dehydrogenase, partial [Rhodanobacteraceae bacterium]
ASGDDPFEYVTRYFETVAMAKASGSALEAKQFGLLRDADVVVFNANELLYVAKNVAASLAGSGWRPPLPRMSHVAGDVGTATIKAQLVNMLAGHFISEHDMEVASRIADTLCGGNVERGSSVDAQWLLDLERHHFMELAQMPKTQARIAHTMATGKPLRN